MLIRGIMSQGLNKVMLLGNLGVDPELRFTPARQAVLNLRLATTESYLDRDKVRQERTDWHDVVVWGPRAEALAKLLAKGSSIFVEGSLRTSSYDDRDGNKRYRTEVVARELVLTGSRQHGGAHAHDGDGHAPAGASARGAEAPAGSACGSAPRGQRGGEGRAPRGRTAPAPPPAAEPPQDDYAGDYGSGGGGDDDIPF